MRPDKRLIYIACAFAISAFSMAGCGLQYASEEFTLLIGPDGSGKLTVLYKNFGSNQDKNHLRTKDLDSLRDAAKSEKIVADASKKGVVISDRRLDFVDYTINGYVEASAKNYKDIFKVFTHYKLVVDDKIYLTPQNGVVARAIPNGAGEITVKNDRYSFAWPLNAKKIAFTASYKIARGSFTYEMRKQFNR